VRKQWEERDDGCWVWSGYIKKDGYANSTRMINGKRPLAHRLVYEMLVGPIPEGMSLDHLCRNRACVNPAHLEPVTLQENILRGEGLAAENARKTHCKRGHPFSEKNTYLYRGLRHCRVCKNLADTRTWADRKARRARV
jgi:hypothetical protein